MGFYRFMAAFFTALVIVDFISGRDWHFNAIMATLVLIFDRLV